MKFCSRFGRSVLIRPLKQGVLATMALFVFHTVCTLDAADSTDNQCQETSAAMLKSCTSGAHEAYWLAIANCENLPTLKERNSCKQKAKNDMKSNLKECKDQFDARQKICKALGGASYNPVINPNDFVDKIDNQYSALTPGTTFIYETKTKDGTEHDEFNVTNDTKEILGVRCVVIKDTVTLNGELIEDTFDWFAQDKDGNIWYFGEEAKQYAGGDLVGIEGSWKAGVDDAQPGIVMKANPQVHDLYRQEFSLGVAEDMGKVISLKGTAKVPYGTFKNCLVTRDFSPLEPDVIENKYYAPNVGLVLTVDPETGDREELIDIKTK